MLTPSSDAMIQGMDQGSQQAQSMLPSPTNPMGKARSRNVFQGPITTMKQGALEMASAISAQGDAYRPIAEKFYKMVYELAKIDNELNDLAMENDKQ